MSLTLQILKKAYYLLRKNCAKVINCTRQMSKKSRHNLLRGIHYYTLRYRNHKQEYNPLRKPHQRLFLIHLRPMFYLQEKQTANNNVDV